MFTWALTLKAVRLTNIGIALSGQIFEGLASDNILHFSLNAIYVQSPDERRVSRLIGVSMALYMIGISISPAVAGLLENFRSSFVMASALFAVSLLYLMLGVQTNRGKGSEQPLNVVSYESLAGETTRSGTGRGPLWNLIKVSASPLSFFATRPLSSIPGFSLLLYNATQSYLFPAIMVHTTVALGFSSRENGFLISIAHGVASTYLLFMLWIAPRMWQIFQRFFLVKESRPTIDNGFGSANALLAIFSLLIQASSITMFAFATKTWQVYSVVALCAFGLASPSFIKSYFVTLFSPPDRPQALAALAMVETLGSLLAPLGFGGLQTLWPGRGVFFAAAACIGLASIVFVTGVVILQIHHGCYKRVNS